MKPIYEKHYLFDPPWFRCGKCRHRLGLMDKYCSQCGERIEWIGQKPDTEADVADHPEERGVPGGRDTLLEGPAVERKYIRRLENKGPGAGKSNRKKNGRDHNAV